MCDYWIKNSGRWKLGFGFAIGIIEIDTSEKIAFDCINNYNDKNNNNSITILYHYQII